MVTVTPASLLHLADLRLLLAAMTAERRQEFPDASVYPTVTEAGLDRFLFQLIDHFRTPEPSFAVFVAVADGGHVVGSLGAQVIPRVAAAPHVIAHGHWLYVLPAVRCQGVGAALVRAGAAWAAAQGVTEVECDALVGDTQWGRRGFVPHAVKWHAPLGVVAVWATPEARVRQDEAPLVAADPVPDPVPVAEDVPVAGVRASTDAAVAERVRRRVNGHRRPRRRPRAATEVAP